LDPIRSRKNKLLSTRHTRVEFAAGSLSHSKDIEEKVANAWKWPTFTVQCQC